MRMYRRILTGVLSFWFLAGAYSVHGDVGRSTRDEATQQINDTTDKILAILADERYQGEANQTERRRKIRETVDQIFNWTEMGRAAADKHWDGASEQQRKEFEQLFADLLEHTYMNKVEDYSGQKVEYGKATGNALRRKVPVRIYDQNQFDISVVYDVRKEQDRPVWLVCDVTIEGISLITDYRDQFDSILSRSSFDEFLRRLRSKVKRLGSQTDK